MDSPFHVISLCAGAGGLDLAVRLAVPGARTVCFVEIEAYACELLASRMEAGQLDPAPVFTDLRRFDGTAWRARIHCIVAGYPCQPFSEAGRRQGNADPRHLWPEVARIMRETEAPFGFFENVAGHLSLGFREVHDELESMGCSVAARLHSAAESGASHRRERLFILAHRNNRRFVGSAVSARSRDQGIGTAIAGGCGDAVADAQRAEWRPHQSTGDINHGHDAAGPEETGRAGERGPLLGDTDGADAQRGGAWR